MSCQSILSPPPNAILDFQKGSGISVTAFMVVLVGMSHQCMAGVIIDDFTSGGFEEVREGDDGSVIRLTQGPLVDVIGGTRRWQISHFEEEGTSVRASVIEDEGVFRFSSNRLVQGMSLSYGSFQSPVNLDLEDSAASVIAIDFDYFRFEPEGSSVFVVAGVSGFDLDGNLLPGNRLLSTGSRVRLLEPMDSPFTLFFRSSDFSGEMVDLSDVVEVGMRISPEDLFSLQINRIRLVPEPFGTRPLVICILLVSLGYSRKNQIR